MHRVPRIIKGYEFDSIPLKQTLAGDSGVPQ